MKKIMSVLITGLLLLSMFFLVSPVSAQTIVVHPGDNLKNILETAPDGSTIYIREGVHEVGDIIEITSNNLTIIGYGPSKTIIKNVEIQFSPDSDSYSKISGIGFDNTGTSWASLLFDKNIYQKVMISDCIIEGGNYGIFVASENLFDLTVTNCEIKDAIYTGIVIQTLFNGYLNGRIFNNLMVGNAFTGISAAASDGTKIELEIENNTIYGPGSSKGISGQGSSTLTVTNNIISNYSTGIFRQGLYSEIIASYNNVWGNTVNYSGVIPGPGSISTDPKFVTGRLGDFYLDPRGPSVNSGSTSSMALGLYRGFTTSVDERWDEGRVDMGFHYPSNRGSPSSLPMAQILKILKGNKDKE